VWGAAINTNFDRFGRSPSMRQRNAVSAARPIHRVKGPPLRGSAGGTCGAAEGMAGTVAQYGASYDPRIE
jgi:hypothetical protein